MTTTTTLTDSFTAAPSPYPPLERPDHGIDTDTLITLFVLCAIGAVALVVYLVHRRRHPERDDAPKQHR